MTEILIGAAMILLGTAAGLGGVTIANQQARNLQSYNDQVSEIAEFKLDLKNMRYSSGYIAPLYTTKDIYSSVLQTATGETLTTQNFGPMIIATYAEKKTVDTSYQFNGVKRILFLKAKDLDKDSAVTFNIASGTAYALDSTKSSFTLPITGTNIASLVVGRPYLLSTLNGSFVAYLDAKTTASLSFSTKGTYQISDTLTAQLPVSLVTSQTSMKALELMEIRTPSTAEIAAGDTKNKIVKYNLYTTAPKTTRSIASTFNTVTAVANSTVNWSSFYFNRGLTLSFQFDLGKGTESDISRKPVPLDMVF